ALITDSLEWTDIDNCSLAPTRRTAGNLLQQLKESGADVRKIELVPMVVTVKVREVETYENK
ncbi:hypothetical protein MJJ05_19400, partial [Salmonella enterica subsp. enterica serovar Anatum]|nr:hypothetical protein [Salmonella enterica subsp. enterica serovar Anatum]